MNYCFNCEKCRKAIPQGQEQKNTQYFLSPRSPYSLAVEYPRIESVKLRLYCPPCFQGVEQYNQQLLNPSDPRLPKPIVDPGVVVYKSFTVEDFDKKTSEKSLKQMLTEDWDNKLREKGKPWEHPNNKSLK